MVRGSSLMVLPSREISSSAGSIRQSPIRKAALSGRVIGDAFKSNE
jgi:hypothetical protein